MPQCLPYHVFIVVCLTILLRSPVYYLVCRICQAPLMTCPLVLRERSVLVLVHLECLAVRVSKAIQHSLRFPLTHPLIYQASVALHPLLLAHLLVPLHPALDPYLQQQCQVSKQTKSFYHSLNYIFIYLLHLIYF